VKVVDFGDMYILRLVCIISTLISSTVVQNKSFIKTKPKLYEHTVGKIKLQKEIIFISSVVLKSKF
jgi:hypothetical protein